LTLDSVTQYSCEVIRNGSKSFAAAARLFDKPTRNSVYLLYAWCRHCDDEIDGQELGFSATDVPVTADPERLERIRNMTQRALDGEPVDEPVFQGLQRVAQQYDIPSRYPLELIEGFAMDVSGRQYRVIEDTLLYCYHVAGVVGIMMAYVMGVRDAATLTRAADLGIAFQLTNIARDVVDDANAGRVYLPEEWLRAEGVAPEEVAAESSRPGVAKVVRDLLEVADRYYDSAYEGIPALKLRAAWAVCTASGVYRDIGEIVIAKGPDAWRERAVVSKWRKLLWGVAGGWKATKAVVLHRRRIAAPRAPDLWGKIDQEPERILPASVQAAMLRRSA
jgi:phytoene synthase